MCANANIFFVLNHPDKFDESAMREAEGDYKDSLVKYVGSGVGRVMRQEAHGSHVGVPPGYRSVPG